MKNLRVGLIQQSCVADRALNIAKSAKAIREAAEKGARLAALQELHTGLYFCQEENASNFDLAEPIPGPSTEAFSSLAKELGIVIAASFFERRCAGLYHNTSVIFDHDGAIAGMYRKMHIPDDPGYYEKFYFTPGDLGFTPVKTSVGNLAVLICWDQWYPEAARLMALGGAELLIYPTAIGWDPDDTAEEQQRQREAWITVQRGHAIANGLSSVSINRVGFEKSPAGKGGQLFWGSSFAVGPQGEMLAQASHDREETVIVDIEMERTEKVRRAWPFLRDRRIDAYGDLMKRFLS
ncbi:MAG: carbon-nitrogen hydrolase [Candidatus Xenobiia bacterium LiM19]